MSFPNPFASNQPPTNPNQISFGQVSTTGTSQSAFGSSAGQTNVFATNTANQPSATGHNQTSLFTSNQSSSLAPNMSNSFAANQPSSFTFSAPSNPTFVQPALGNPSFNSNQTTTSQSFSGFGQPPNNTNSTTNQSLFGTSTSAKPFGTASTSNNQSSFFGSSKPTTTSTSQFGSNQLNTAPSQSVFGSNQQPTIQSSTTNPIQASLGSNQPTSTSNPNQSLFSGNQPTTNSSQSFFGNVQPTANNPSQYVLGGSQQVAAANPSQSSFGVNQPAITTNNLFGSSQVATTTNPNQSLFGADQPASITNNSSLFGTTSTSGQSLFGSNPQSTSSNQPSSSNTGQSSQPLFGANQPSFTFNQPTSKQSTDPEGKTVLLPTIKENVVKSSPPITFPSTLKGKTLEEIVIMWKEELEEQVSCFHRQAIELSKWDKEILKNEEDLLSLADAINSTESQAVELDQSLAFLSAQQAELEGLLELIEKELPLVKEAIGQVGPLNGVDSDRDSCFEVAEKVQSQLNELSKNLHSLYKDLPANDGDDQILSVLNAQCESLLWIDSQLNEVDRVKGGVKKLAEKAVFQQSRLQ